MLPLLQVSGEQTPSTSLSPKLSASFARMVAKRSGSLSETQDALRHRHASTTRVYVDSIAIKTDKYSQHILEALELPDFEIGLD